MTVETFDRARYGTMSVADLAATFLRQTGAHTYHVQRLKRLLPQLCDVQSIPPRERWWTGTGRSVAPRSAMPQSTGMSPCCAASSIEDPTRASLPTTR